MKVPYNWLNKYLDAKIDVVEMAEKFTHIGYMLDGQVQDTPYGPLLDLEVRQNRFDCYSLTGLARELAAVTHANFIFPELAQLPAPSPDSTFSLEIEDDTKCYRFCALLVENIKVLPSPDWLQDSLESYGIKSVNNIVDLTNYVMVELGEPMHAYDQALITGNRLRARAAKPQEKLVVIGGRQVELNTDDLVISDENDPLALAGVIGGKGSEISKSTTSILVEAATFNQANVRRTSNAYQLRTEASTRHEKFNHPDLSKLALMRFVYLLRLIQPEAKVVSYLDTYPSPLKSKQLTLSLDRLNQLSGMNFEIELTSRVLASLEFSPKILGNDTLSVEVPYFRTDVSEEEDLIEEVLRIHGYDQIPEVMPAIAPPPPIVLPRLTLEEQARDALVGMGFDETISVPLTFEANPGREPIMLENSLASDKAMLRTSLKADLKTAVISRKKHNQSDARVFEVGKIYYSDNQHYHEESVVGLAALAYSLTYRQFKGYIENLLILLDKPATGQIEIQLEEDIYFAQVSLDELLSLSASSQTQVYTSVPHRVFQDFSFKVNSDASVGGIVNLVKSLDKLVDSVILGEDPRVESGAKSVFLKVTYASDKSLSSQDVEPIRSKIIDELKSVFQAVFSS